MSSIIISQGQFDAFEEMIWTNLKVKIDNFYQSSVQKTKLMPEGQRKALANASVEEARAMGLKTDRSVFQYSHLNALTGAMLAQAPGLRAALHMSGNPDRTMDAFYDMVLAELP